MQETPERFADRKHVIPAGWAVVTSVLAGIICLWLGQYLFSGPQEVVVTNPVDTVVVAERGIPDGGVSAEQLENMMRRLLDSEPGARQSPSPIPARTAPSRASSTPLSNDTNLLQIPGYRLPSNVNGWTQRSLSAFASGSCPQRTVPQGSLVTVSFDLLDSVPIEAATPIFLRVNEKEGSDIVAQRLDQQYQLRRGRNVIQFNSDFQPGSYELAVGFYLESELGQEFPPFYAKRCTFRVA